MQATPHSIRAILKSGVPLLLEGPTGTGKTYTIMEIAKEQGKTLHVINVSGELTVDSILGQQTLLDGNVIWHDGVLTQAMRKGDWVLFDELNTALPEVLTVINGVLDDSHSVTLPNADNERVQAHKDFRFVGTQNPANGSYAGTARLNDALLNRMVKMTVGYMEFDAEVQALKKHTKLSDSTIVQIVRLAEYTREEMEEPLSTRDLVKILRLKEEGGMSLRDAIYTVAMTRYSAMEYNKIHSRHSSIMRELEDAGYSHNEDPFEVLKKKMVEIKDKERKLEQDKRDLRAAVRKEILRDFLAMSDGSTPDVPEGF